MIDPDNVTNYNLTKDQKEEFLLFCVCVAGKSAFTQAKKLEEFLERLREQYYLDQYKFAPTSPFELLRMLRLTYIEEELREVRMGQYKRLVKTIDGIIGLDVDTVTVEQLEAVPGIGPKTARFFIVHTRKDAVHAILDTHILAHLRGLRDKNGNPLYEGVPDSTPQSKILYARLEAAVLAEVKKTGMTPADWDLMVWKSRRRKS